MFTEGRVRAWDPGAYRPHRPRGKGGGRLGRNPVPDVLVFLDLGGARGGGLWSCEQDQQQDLQAPCRKQTQGSWLKSTEEFKMVTAQH